MGWDSKTQINSINHAIGVMQPTHGFMCADVVVTFRDINAKEHIAVAKQRLTLGYDHTNWARCRFIDKLNELAMDEETLDITGIIWFNDCNWTESHQEEFMIDWCMHSIPDRPHTCDKFPYAVFREHEREAVPGEINWPEDAYEPDPEPTFISSSQGMWAGEENRCQSCGLHNDDCICHIPEEPNNHCPDCGEFYMGCMCQDSIVSGGDKPLLASYQDYPPEGDGFDRPGDDPERYPY